jgi:hypothetical protein
MITNHPGKEVKVKPTHVARIAPMTICPSPPMLMTDANGDQQKRCCFYKRLCKRIGASKGTLPQSFVGFHGIYFQKEQHNGTHEQCPKRGKNRE